MQMTLISFNDISRISLYSKLVPVQNREYEYGILPLVLIGLLDCYVFFA